MPELTAITADLCEARQTALLTGCAKAGTVAASITLTDPIEPADFNADNWVFLAGTAFGDLMNWHPV